MPDLMKNTKCIPCSPDGVKFKYPHDIMNPKSNLATLFLPEDGIFPCEKFLSSNSLILMGLDKLGLMQSLSWKHIVDRLKCVYNWYSENSKEALNRLAILMGCIRDKSIDEMPDKQIQLELQRVAFLPVMKKPNNYPISWKGGAVANLLPGPELIKVSQDVTGVNAVYACGSQVAILDTQFLPQQSSNLSNEFLKLLGIQQEIEVNDVIKHFNELLQWFQNCTDEFSPEVVSNIDTIATNVYQYLDKKLNTNSDDDDLLNGITFIKKNQCIWNGKQFISPTHVSFSWITSGPYLYNLPDKLQEYSRLMEQFGVKSSFPAEIILNALREMKIENKDSSLPMYENTFRQALSYLKDYKESGDMEIFLPDTDFVLRNAKELKYNDAKWCGSDKQYVYCNECVDRTIAVQLGVEPVRSILLNEHDITSDELGEEFGQEEKLTQRLNNILKDYPRDITFLKELLQNADDAEATKLYFILDKRWHNDESIVSDKWKPMQGPALLFWNDSPFTDDDLVGIQKIGLGNKRYDPDKIGQYGIGFNVVYHFTDCPSFVTSDRLCILDPHYRYIAHNRREKPGRMYNNLEMWWEKFPDMKSPYLRNDLDDFPKEMKGGSLFRLPLRLTKEDAEQSEIVENDGYFDLQEFQESMEEWVPQMREALLFVHHVCDIRLYVIDDVQSVGVFQWDDPQPVVLRSHIESSRGKEKVVMKTGNAKLVIYNMKLANKRTNKEEKWLIQLGEGNADNVSFNWKAIQPKGVEVHPRHGIAALFDDGDFDNKEFCGKAFCFLPLPGITQLPVHIHGQFMLHSDRRCLWISSTDTTAADADNKFAWNKHLIEAIAVSYANLLIRSIAKKASLCSRKESQKSLQNYYKLFPFVTKSTESWKRLASSVYEILSKLNPPILATIVLENGSTTSENKFYLVKWHKLHLQHEPNEGYFHSFHPDKTKTYNALKSIGMNLIDTPFDICQEFKQVGINLPILSAESALDYFIRFHDEIFNHKTLPCHVSESRFGNVSNFVSFLSYICKYIHNSDAKSAEDSTSDDRLDGESPTSTSSTSADNVAIDAISATETITSAEVVDSTSHVEYFCDINDMLKAGLIMTADEHIHLLSDGKKIINSDNWELFSQSYNAFLHKSLMLTKLKKTFTEGGLIFQSSKNGDGISVIHSVLSANLPESWCRKCQAPLGDVNILWVEKLLICISEDPVFEPYCCQLLQYYTLIPDKKDTMYSIESEILPMKANVLDHIKQTILRKLHVPFVKNSSKLDSTLAKINFELPDIRNARDVLKSVYLAYKKHRDALLALNTEELTVLFELFGSVDFRNYDSIAQLKKIPIFHTIHGNLIELSSYRNIWIWNDNVCKIGIKEWLNKSEAFLKPDAPWNTINMHAREQLGIKEISLYEIYCNYIFCRFSTMSSATRLKHIEFISLNVFYQCKHHYTNEDSPKHGLANEFVYTFKSLPCIGDNPPLHTIGSFFDHNQEIFTFFCMDDCFLPKELQHDKMYECLKFFGLKTVPTINDFVSYCNSIQLHSQVLTAERASELLLKYLFTKDSTDAKNYIIRGPDVLSRISRIPIAIIKLIPELNAISTQKVGDYELGSDGETFHLAQLSGSYPEQCMHSVWTCRPLIDLPVTHPFSQEIIMRMKDLGILDTPTISDAVQNLKNIASTRFADVSRFNKDSTSEAAQCSFKLPEVVADTLKCIENNIDKTNYNAQCEWLKSQLQNVNFIPVKVHEPANGYNLVSPNQVVFISHSRLHLVAPYYPYLHPLIDELCPYLHLLSHTGVAMSFDISHVHFVLNKAKELCQENPVHDESIKNVVMLATVKLTNLLIDTEDKENAYLHPLYLLNVENILTECSQLVVFDISGEPPTLPAGLTYLNPLHNSPITRDWNPVKLLSLLPKELGLLGLRSILEYKMVNATPLQTAHPYVASIEQILFCKKFKVAIEKYACHCTHKHEPPTEVIAIIENFQQNLEVQFLDKIEVEQWLFVNNQSILLPDKIYKDFFLQYDKETYRLTLKNSPQPYSSRVFTKLSRNLCSNLQLKATKCFEIADDDDAPELTSFICDILSCGSVYKVAEVIQESIPGIRDIEQELVTPNPLLGEVILECWHHRLDQNMFNTYLPEEWVGYGADSGKVVYAQLLHSADTEAPIEEDALQAMKRKYFITTGNGQIVVTAIQIYKLMSELPEFLELESPKTSDSSTGDKVMASNQSLKERVKAAWSLPIDQKQKAFKRLYLQYHPDKNPHAMTDFHCLRVEIESMGKKCQEEIHKAPDSFSFDWNGLFVQWNRIASSHQNYRKKDRGTSIKGVVGGWQTPKPHIDYDEARRWINQADCDYATLATLMASCQRDKESVLTPSKPNQKMLCPSLCFMSHEVAEKSLKAGMYATCGMGNATLKNPNIVHPAHALVQMGCKINVGDADFLENFSTKTRYPHEYSSTILPGEKHAMTTAEDAFNAATRIYEVMKNLVENDD